MQSARCSQKAQLAFLHLSFLNLDSSMVHIFSLHGAVMYAFIMSTAIMSSEFGAWGKVAGILVM
ncbi:hypothetical protein ACHAXS_009668 [Conticribra weissflogii]